MNYIAKLLMNSLYGRFGMDDNFTITKILDNKEYSKFELNKNIEIKDVIEIGDKTLIQYHLDNLNTLLDNGTETHNVNIAIASAITSYARIHMSQFKNNPNYNLYYSDTDSIIIDRELPKDLVNINLGFMKLENKIKKGIFLAPKVYGYVTENNKEIIKVKGKNKSKLSIKLNDLFELLKRDNKMELDQEKWYKDIELAQIEIKNQIYTLKVTDNKRELIYENDVLIRTEPYVIKGLEKLITPFLY